MGSLRSLSAELNAEWVVSRVDLSKEELRLRAKIHTSLLATLQDGREMGGRQWVGQLVQGSPMTGHLVDPEVNPKQ